MSQLIACDDVRVDIFPTIAANDVIIGSNSSKCITQTSSQSRHLAMERMGDVVDAANALTAEMRKLEREVTVTTCAFRSEKERGKKAL